MKHTSLILASTTALFLASCENPADDTASATVGEAVKVAPATPAAGVEYVFAPDSQILFTGSKVTGSHDGGFKAFTGTIDLTEDGKGVRAMAACGTVAVLLPGAFHVLRETKLPPLDLLRQHGVPMAVATDCNPGTSPLLSLRQAMQLACTHFRLTPEEALRGATANAAKALGLGDRGILRAGLRADFALWRIRHPAELCYWLGGPLLHASYAGGHRLA